MTSEQLAKIRWLRRVKTAERNAFESAEIYRHKQEIVHSMQKDYRIQSTPSKRNIIEAKILDLLDAERDMNTMYSKAEEVSVEVNRAIQSLDDRQLANVLNARYMLFLTHEQTAELLHVSVKTAVRLHKKALDALQVVPL